MSVFTKRGHLRKGTYVRVRPIWGKVLNPIYLDSVLVGYRIETNDKFLIVVPSNTVSTIREKS